MSERPFKFVLGVMGLVLFLAVMVFPTGKVSALPVTVFSSNFDNDAPLGLSKIILNDWNVTASNVDILGPGTFDFFPGNGHYLDMEGTNSPLGANATIVSKATLNLVPGTYRLSFKLGENTFFLPPGPIPNGLQVSVGSVFSQHFLAPGVTTSFVPMTVQFTVSTATTANLIFQETGTPNNMGTVLDDVLLELIALAPTDFPATLDIAKAEVKLDKKAGKDRFEVKGFLTLSADSDGVDILNEDVTVTLGDFSETIPAGSFVQVLEGFQFHSGSASGIDKVKIRNDGRFEVKAKRLDLGAIDFADPVPFSLRIDNDLGETELLLESDKKGRKFKLAR